VLVRAALDAALGARTVVREEQHDGVVQMATLVERGEETPDLCIGVGEKAGEHLLLAGHHPPFVVGQRIPRADPLRPLAQRRPRRDDSRFELAGEAACAPGIPAIVECSSVGCHPLGGDVVGACIAPSAKYKKNGLPGAAW